MELKLHRRWSILLNQPKLNSAIPNMILHEANILIFQTRPLENSNSPLGDKTQLDLGRHTKKSPLPSLKNGVRLGRNKTG
jgi:hypothetical protein